MVEKSSDVVVSLDDLRDVQRLAMVSYKTLSNIIAGIDYDSVSWSTQQQLDYSRTPWRFYKLVVKDSSLSIHRSRDGNYSLDCFNFNPRYTNPSRSRHGSVRNLFGDFPSLQEALVAFCKESYSLLLDVSGMLF